MSDVSFAVLGPVMACSRGTFIKVTGATALTILAGLLVSANLVVPSETLIRWAWPGQQPGNPKGALHNAISRLRKLIGEGSITTLSWGYVLQADGDRLDLLKFRALRTAAARAAEAGAPEQALALLDEAVGLWSRPVLGGVTSEVLLTEALPQLTEQYLAAVEQRAALRLRLRRSTGLPEELAELVREHPFRETLVGHQMAALYQAGRRSEALAVFHALRVALSRDLGIAPSAALEDLYGALVQDAPVLDRWLGAGR